MSKVYGVRGRASTAILVWLSAESLTSNQLAERMGNTTTFASHVLDKVRRQGWVSASRGFHDKDCPRMVNLWSITDAGRHALALTEGEGRSEPCNRAVAMHGPETAEIDGDVWAKCRHCDRKGYGPDSWHPATPEFFRSIGRGALLLTQCLACMEETKRRNTGFLPEDFDLTFRKAA